MKNIKLKSILNESDSEEQKLVRMFLIKIAKRHGYSLSDAGRFIKDTIIKMGF